MKLLADSDSHVHSIIGKKPIFDRTACAIIVAVCAAIKTLASHVGEQSLKNCEVFVEEFTQVIFCLVVAFLVMPAIITLTNLGADPEIRIVMKIATEDCVAVLEVGSAVQHVLVPKFINHSVWNSLFSWTQMDES